MKTLNDYLNVIVPVIVFLIPFFQLSFNKTEKGFKRITKLGYVCFVIALIMGFNTYLGNRVKDIDKTNSDKENHIKDSISNARFDSLQVAMMNSKRALNSNMNEIKVALKDRNFFWDSINKKITTINSGINMPYATFNGNTLVGSRSKQINNTK